VSHEFCQPLAPRTALHNQAVAGAVHPTRMTGHESLVPSVSAKIAKKKKRFTWSVLRNF
jgi:hypothetical protein